MRNVKLILEYEGTNYHGWQVQPELTTIQGTTQDTIKKILGEEVVVNAKLRAIGGYSAHADQPALLSWLQPMRKTLKKVFLIQGEIDQMIPLSHKISDEMALDVEVPEPGSTVVL